MPLGVFMSLILEWFVSLLLECVACFSIFWCVLLCYFGPLRVIQLMSWEIRKVRIKTGAVGIITTAYLSQQNIVHILKYSIYSMSIAGIRQVDSWGEVSLISIYTIGISEHWAINGSHVLRSIVILLFSGMSVQFELIWMSLISFLDSRIFIILLVKQSENKLFCFST